MRDWYKGAEKQQEDVSNQWGGNLWMSPQGSTLVVSGANTVSVHHVGTCYGVYVPHTGPVTKELLQALSTASSRQQCSSWVDKRAEGQGGVAIRRVSRLEKVAPASKLLKSSPGAG